jgi:hypothetical protein
MCQRRQPAVDAIAVAPERSGDSLGTGRESLARGAAITHGVDLVVARRRRRGLIDRLLGRAGIDCRFTAEPVERDAVPEIAAS